ncbi:DNA topoisomerase (ATP-hydrolyzing) subunit B [Entomospira culicis]|uniref:DNA gyrase subunit B n=1 Tax=Entomospira culicis TaxID=2719989 RepID=A0A968GFV7_9SPIO|nr:DNA topoisomerase (ATP-hydrolyzing) subunit B [Entomospira culicis]NIZ19357.1 DNA topoisomerase (ATP-hydrolyzing) subunit B [Entomospira culicis]NIZ69738.1 DNA topoisomerase (ATP-hydrolyzing) subunit B [Entomospira culicis]WDI36850.1 DNA topoisomerase (ATP-hydrolyzing) subunit B [Entomospira culicis]WDI38479.1 DNA topoisomerase (ATP-hydrolyzing) subunit B [Entomospira culicis]
MAKEYDAQNIQVLKGLEAVRVRPGMYIGSTGPDGLHHMVYEVVDNSIDEALAGFCTTIVVAIEKDNIIRVEDNGRGIPVDMHEGEGMSALELVMTRLHAGGKFDKDTYKVSGGLHGVGVSVVNALSHWLEATVHRDGTIYQQKFARGITQNALQTLGSTTKVGTTIRFHADNEIFTETTHYSFDVLAIRLRELAFLNKGIHITLIDEREGEEQERLFFFEDGVSGFVRYLNKGKSVLHPHPIYLETEKEGVLLEIAMQYNDSYSENISTYVNNINTREGGTHLTGFRSALTRAINKSFEISEADKKDAKLKAGKKVKTEEIEGSGFSGEDVREGLTAVISIKVPNPQFEGQTKQKLGNSEVKGIVDSAVYERLMLYFEENPSILQAVLAKAMLAARARIAARKARERERKNVLSGGGLPGKLTDCSEKDPQKCEVFIVEGDSAGGSAKQGRNPAIQAILPLWGKMLNVEKTRLDKVIDNEKLQPIILALGASVGEEFNLEKLRYHKVIIMADADVDGSHINTLLLTFFFRYMQPLITHGHVYLACPPLYKMMKGSGKSKEIFYAYSDEERDGLMREHGFSDKDDIQRFKGLGEMNYEELWRTTMDPSRRRLKLIKLEDAVEADLVFSMLMGDEVPPRRQFIEENALYVTNLDI